MQFVLDPAVLGPPPDGEAALWIKKIQDMSSLVLEQGLTATSARLPCDQMVSLWYSAWESRGAVAGYELARMAEEVAARLSVKVPTSELPPLVDQISLKPSYADERISPEARKELEIHLGEAACARRDGANQLGVLGNDQSWGEAGTHVLVEAEVIGRERPDEELVEAVGEDTAIREFLERLTSVRDIYSRCFQRPCALMQNLDLGVRACWLTEFNGKSADLKFEIGPECADSVAAMNYSHLPANAKKCLRVMALIAAGRSDQLEGHEERVGKGGNNKTLRVDGAPVMRAYIANHTPNAHRLFWIRKETPVILNVTGHEGRPAL